MSKEANVQQEFDLVTSLTEINREIRTGLGSAALASYITSSGPVASLTKQESHNGLLTEFVTYKDTGSGWERTLTFFSGNGWQLHFSDQRPDVPDFQKRDYLVSKTPKGEILFEGNISIGQAKKIIGEFFLTGVLNPGRPVSPTLESFLDSSPEADENLIHCAFSSLPGKSFVQIPVKQY